MSTNSLLQIVRCTLEQMIDLPLVPLSKAWDGKNFGKSLQWSWGFSDEQMFFRGRWEKPVMRSLGELAACEPGLWQGDVLECFVGRQNTPSYYEFNFSPSGGWWAARFTEYRTPEPGWSNPFAVICEREESDTAVDVVWALRPCPGDLFQLSEVTANVTACKVDFEGRTNYLSWTAPLDGAPDFHLAALRLPVKQKVIEPGASDDVTPPRSETIVH